MSCRHHKIPACAGTTGFYTGDTCRAEFIRPSMIIEDLNIRHSLACSAPLRDHLLLNYLPYPTQMRLQVSLL